jgi:hypothetical protein
MPLDAPPGIAILDTAVTAAGTTQATATPLDALTSIVTTVPANAGVRLLAAGLYTQTIVNAGANVLNIWPQTGMAIGVGGTANAAVTVNPGRSMGIVVTSPTQAHIVFNTSSFG